MFDNEILVWIIHYKFRMAEVTFEDHNIINIKIISCEGNKYGKKAMGLDIIITHQL